jgi:PKHD-type hydroxylase
MIQTHGNVFSVEECQKIIAARMREDLKPAYSPGMMVDPDIRSSMVNFIYDDDEEWQWVFERLWELSREHPLGAIVEKLPFIQFGEYDSHYAGHFKPHRDTENFYHATDRKNFTRKLTTVIQLSDPNSYAGGEVKLYGTVIDNEALVGQKDRGCAIMFPSDTLHEVTKVTAGIRYSLSAWFEGRV